MALEVEQSRDIPVSVDDAFHGTLPMPLPTLFRRWYGPIPPISRILNQTADWSTVGESRTIVLTGGGSMREELTNIDPPRAFGYTLTEIKGPMAPLVGLIEGEWRFDPAGTGTKVTWKWVLYPRSRLAAPALPVFGLLWRGYARQALEDLSERLVG